ncbi:hypothetical protein [Lunatimonas salinarum]|uniref:hypothetical protein n=1 Tax=Lunatimonas salinarum TaxID=1774590 RepID=UPI001AE040CC|nr:hypothetical protein [Lunatimonas salinarum]
MNQFPLFKKHLFSFVFVLSVGFLVGSCGPKVYFPVSSVVPAAEPKAAVKKTKEGAYEVKLDVTNLALPERLSPPKRSYVVWVNTERQGVVNIGELRNRRGMLANTGKANFVGSLSEKPTQIIVTAENDPSVQFTGAHTVFRSDIFYIKK